jgi:hypothetical protein
LLTILHPQVIPYIQGLPIGLWPLSFKNKADPRLLIKTTKEMLLAAKVNGGFKVYVIPITLSGRETIGLISAFFFEVRSLLQAIPDVIKDRLPAFFDNTIEGVDNLASDLFKP